MKNNLVKQFILIIVMMLLLGSCTTKKEKEFVDYFNSQISIEDIKEIELYGAGGNNASGFIVDQKDYSLVIDFIDECYKNSNPTDFAVSKDGIFYSIFIYTDDKWCRISYEDYGFSSGDFENDYSINDDYKDKVKEFFFDVTSKYCPIKNIPMYIDDYEVFDVVGNSNNVRYSIKDLSKLECQEIIVFLDSTIDYSNSITEMKEEALYTFNIEADGYEITINLSENEIRINDFCYKTRKTIGKGKNEKELDLSMEGITNRLRTITGQ